MVKRFALMGLAMLLPVVASAQELFGQSIDPAHDAVWQRPWHLAAAQSGVSPALPAAPDDSKPLFKDRWLTGNKLHQYLGIGSIALAGLAVLAPKPGKDENDSVHQELAEGAAALGGLAVATGLGFHYDELSLSRGFRDPDNLHALLAALGALGFIAAVNEAPDGGHAGVGVISAAAMLTAIKITW